MLKPVAIVVKSILCAFIIIAVSVKTMCAQKDYSNYYQKRTEAICNGNSDDVNMLIRQLGQEYELLSEDVVSLSNTYFLSGNISLAKKYLLRAVTYGLDPETASQITYADSLSVLYPGFRKKIHEKNQSFYRDRCDLMKVNSIANIYAFDQSIRGINRKLLQSDTILQKKFRRIFDEQDSIDFVNICSIIREPDFDPSRLTTDAIKEMHLILMHAASNPSIHADSVFKVIWDLVIMGAFHPYQYAAAYDRYYHVKYNMNYYAEFYDSRLPIYEPQNLDKRRAEIWLCPLWKDYERGGILDRLPREYKDYVKIN